MEEFAVSLEHKLHFFCCIYFRRGIKESGEGMTFIAFNNTSDIRNQLVLWTVHNIKCFYKMIKKKYDVLFFNK